MTVWIDNLFADACRTAPEDREQLLSRLVDETIRSAEGLVGQQAEQSLDQVVPTIKSAQFIEWAPTKDLASEHLVADLYVVYAFDLPTSMKYASWTDLERLGRTRTELRYKALSNLRALLPAEFGKRGSDKSFIFLAGGNYESSLILLDEVWEQVATSIPKDIVVCVLARDLCIVTSTALPGGLESLVAARDRWCADGMPSNFISKTLLRRCGSEWIEFQEIS